MNEMKRILDALRRSAPKVLNIKGFSTKNVLIALVSGSAICTVLGVLTLEYEHLKTLLTFF